jgi:hypothetical protein
VAVKHTVWPMPMFSESWVEWPLAPRADELGWVGDALLVTEKLTNLCKFIL